MMQDVRHPEGSPWERTSLVEESAIDHERQIGRVPASNEFIDVRVAQRVDFDLLADPVVVHPSEPRICVGLAYELNEEEAATLIQYLQEAKNHVADLKAQQPRTRLGPGEATVP